jgi:hypothetical protein
MSDAAMYFEDQLFQAQAWGSKCDDDGTLTPAVVDMINKIADRFPKQPKASDEIRARMLFKRDHADAT